MVVISSDFQGVTKLRAGSLMPSRSCSSMVMRSLAMGSSARKDARGNAGNNKPRCLNCQIITGGIKFLGTKLSHAFFVLFEGFQTYQPKAACLTTLNFACPEQIF